MKMTQIMSLTFWTRIQLLLVLSLIAASAATPIEEGVFYVAPQGNDQWSGRVSSPNRAKSDGPSATIQRAVELARDWKSKIQGGGATIYLAPGIYFLKQPVILRPDDSGLT